MHTITVDDSKRVRLPDVKPRQVLDYAANADGSILLTPVKKAEPKGIPAKLVRRKGHLIFEVPKGYTVPEGAIAQSIREERDSR